MQVQHPRKIIEQTIRVSVPEPLGSAIDRLAPHGVEKRLMARPERCVFWHFLYESRKPLSEGIHVTSGRLVSCLCWKNNLFFHGGIRLSGLDNMTLFPFTGQLSFHPGLKW